MSTRTPKPETLLTKDEVAMRLRICRKTVERYARQLPGFPPAVELGDRQVRFRESEVDKFIRNLGRRVSTGKSAVATRE